MIATAGFAFVIGTVSKSVASAGLSSSVKQQLHKLGSVQIATPSGYIGLTFLFFVLAVSLFGRIGALRRRHRLGDFLLVDPRHAVRSRVDTAKLSKANLPLDANNVLSSGGFPAKMIERRF